MGHLLPALTEAKFENQREVVLNERRQNYENRPYGLADDGDRGGAVPARPSVPLADDWVGRRPACRVARRGARLLRRPTTIPRNASLAVAGDIDSGRALELVAAYFGDVPPGPDVAPVVRAASLAGTERLLLEDRVELPRLYLAWHSPAMFAGDDGELDLVADLLGNGKTSRLYRSLVYERRMATEVAAFQNSRELGSFFQVIATAAPGHTLAELEARRPRGTRHAHRRRPDRRRDGARRRAGRGAVRVSAADGRRLRRQVGSAERLQRVPRRSGLLRPRSRSATRRRAANGSATPPATWLGAAASRDAERRAAWTRRPRGDRFGSRRWSSDPRSIARSCRRSGRRRCSTSRSSRKRRLANGLGVWTVEHASVPVVTFVLLVTVGSAADPADRSGPGRRSRATCSTKAPAPAPPSRCNDALARIGAGFDTEVGPDATFLTLTTLARFRDRGLGLLADLVVRPRFEAHEFERVRQLRAQPAPAAAGPAAGGGRSRVRGAAVRRASRTATSRSGRSRRSRRSRSTRSARSTSGPIARRTPRSSPSGTRRTSELVRLGRTTPSAAGPTPRLRATSSRRRCRARWTRRPRSPRA